MKKLDRLAERAKASAGSGKYAYMGWAILENDGSWTARLDLWTEKLESGESITSSGHKTEEECLDAVNEMIDQYPPKSTKDKVSIIVDDTLQ